MSTRRRALLTTAACGLVAALFATGPASAGTPTDYSVTDPAGDAPAVVDLTKVRVYPTTGDYRATLTYRDLKPRASTRWLISFTDYSQRRGDPGFGRYGNAVELRISPNGVVKTKTFDVYTDNSYQSSSCQGITATPNWNLNKIKIVIPQICWNLDTGTASVNVLNRAFTAAEGWSTDVYDLEEGSKRDSASFGWSWAMIW